MNTHFAFFYTHIPLSSILISQVSSALWAWDLHISVPSFHNSARFCLFSPSPYLDILTTDQPYFSTLHLTFFHSVLSHSHRLSDWRCSYRSKKKGGKRKAPLRFQFLRSVSTYASFSCSLHLPHRISIHHSYLRTLIITLLKQKWSLRIPPIHSLGDFTCSYKTLLQRWDSTKDI